MTKTKLRNGFYRLTGENGVVDKRNGAWYSEVVVKKANVRFYEDAPAEDEEQGDES